VSFSVLIVDDEENARKNVSTYLNASGYEAAEADSIKSAKKQLNELDIDMVILDVDLKDGKGTDLLVELNSLPVRIPVIMITGYGDIEMAVDAMKNGAHDFITKPIDFDNLTTSLERGGEIIQMRRELNHLRQSQLSTDNFVIGQTEEMKRLVEYAQKAAEKSVSVLITGETGTGKEVLALFIHENSPRRDKPFMAISCASIQPTVLESELFGHEKGSFTGADTRKIGLMEIADGGILFLDEISSMPTDIQAKLLRALEERAFRRVGGEKLIHVDIHLIAASNRDLKQMIAEGQFREDLYYRLKVVDLNLPSLVQRKNDIPDLVGYFIGIFNLKMGLNVTGISTDALSALKNHTWEGNIRELKNAIERAMLFSDGETIQKADLPYEIWN
jgi:two-component system, NtrC family, response regulator AtoC